MPFRWSCDARQGGAGFRSEGSITPEKSYDPPNKGRSGPNKSSGHTPNTNVTLLTFFTAAYSVETFTAAFLTAVFFATAFLLAAFFGVRVTAFVFAALTVAQRLRAASAIAFLPAALIFRFGLASALIGVDGSDSPRIFAHRRCWASFILRRVSAENFRRLGAVPSGLAAFVTGLPVRRLRSSAI